MRTLKFLIILLIILLLLCPAQVVLGAPKDPNDDKAPKDDKQNQSDQENKTNQGNQDSKDNKTNQGNQPNQTTQTSQTNQANQGNSGNDKTDKKTEELNFGTFSGKFLDFDYDLAKDEFVYVSVYDDTIFDKVIIKNGSFTKQKVSNYLFKGNGDGAKFIAHDNPLCLMQFKANNNISILLDIAESWTEKKIDDKEVNLKIGSIKIALRLLGKPGSIFLKDSIYDFKIFLPNSSKLKIHIIDLSALTTKAEAPGMFWFDETKQSAFNGIYDESFAGDATITGLAQGPNTEVYTYVEDFNFDVKNIDADAHQVTLQVSSTDPAGKFILLSALKESLGIPLETNSDVKISIDNDEIPEVPDPSLFSTSKAGYYRSFDNEAEQVMISVPQFSEHTISIKFIPRIIPEEIRPEKVWGYLDFIAIMIILFVIIIAGVYLYLDRRE